VPSAAACCRRLCYWLAADVKSALHLHLHLHLPPPPARARGANKATHAPASVKAFVSSVLPGTRLMSTLRSVRVRRLKFSTRRVSVGESIRAWEGTQQEGGAE
jgi:hypothetical protein